MLVQDFDFTTLIIVSLMLIVENWMKSACQVVTCEILTRGDFLATGTIYRAELLHAFGGCTTQTRNSSLENYELILRLIDSGVQCAFGKESLSIPTP